MAKSIMGYIFKWLAIKFLPHDKQAEAGVILREEPSLSVTPPSSAANVGPLTKNNAMFMKPQLRFDHGPQRRVLLVPLLRIDEGLLVGNPEIAPDRRVALRPPFIVPP